MRHISRILVSSFFALFLVNCTHVSNSAENVVSIEGTDMSKLSSMKTGEACRNNILFLIAWGTDNISEAAKNGDIQYVNFVEKKYETYLIFNKFCTVVYGSDAPAASAPAPAKPPVKKRRRPASSGG
jgi:hypothetical protein